MFEAGLTVEPVMFGPLARAIFNSRRVLPRHLDFLVRIEQGLLGIDQAASPVPSSLANTDTGSPDAGGKLRKWSKVNAYLIFSL